MWHKYCLVTAIASYFVAPALADLIDITFGGNASGGGEIVARCLVLPPESCPTGGDSESFGFAGGADANGDLNASGSATADKRITLSGQVQQRTTVSPSNVIADLLSSAAFSSEGAEYGDMLGMTNTYVLNFTLTTDSLMHLTTAQQISSSGDAAGGLHDELFFWSLLGPVGFDSGPTFPTVDQSMTLISGQYSLVVHDATSGSFVGAFVEGHSSDQIFLDADFTSMVPEPRWSAIVPILLVIIGVCIRIRGAGRGGV